MIEWEDLRKQARKLENEIDLKLVSFSKLGTGTVNTYKSNESDMEPLLSTEHVFDSVAVEIEQLLAKLSIVNEKLGEIASSEQGSGGGAAMLHTLQRHRDILQDYTQEFRKTQQNYRARRERENLLHSVKKDIEKYTVEDITGQGIGVVKALGRLTRGTTARFISSSYKNSSGLNRRMDLYMKENKHIRNSERLVDDQISIAVETREHLLSQRLSMKRIQTRIHDLGSRFPVVNSLVQRINLRKRRDSLILGLVVAICTFLILLYLFR